MSDDLQKILEGLRKDYLKNLPARIELITDLIAKGETALVKTEFHKLKGTGKTYGLPEVSEVGFLGEHLCKAPADIQKKGLPIAVHLMRQILQARQDGGEFNTQTSSQFSELQSLYEQHVPKE